jgi:hypothetical protein
VLTSGPDQAALLAVLDELLAAPLPGSSTSPSPPTAPNWRTWASLALKLPPQPGLVVPLVGQMPQQSLRLAVLAATVASQQVTQYRADGRETLAAIHEAVTIRGSWPPDGPMPTNTSQRGFTPARRVMSAC